MSAIAGFVSQGLNESHLHAMLDTARFGGAEGLGQFQSGNLCAGACQLAFLDKAHGQQPHLAKGGNVAAFLNGEIYNFAALREELEGKGCVFKTDCDTEVLAQSYAVWGWPGFLQHLDGMFAVAIVDVRANQLLLARDRFGEKSLYFTHCDEGFAFGSTLLSVSAMPWVSDAWDNAGLDYYLSLQFVPGSRTLLKDVEQLLPGESLALDLQSLTYVRYRYYVPSPKEESATDDALSSALQSSIASRMRANAPLGVLLSGGMGSALIAALAASAQPGIRTYAVGIESADNARRHYAERVAGHLGTSHTSLNLTLGELLDVLPRVAASMDTPVGDPSVLPLFCLAQVAGQDLAAMLVECGAEEAFAGHGYYRPFLAVGAEEGWRTRLLNWVSRLKGRASPSSSGNDPCPGLFDEANRNLRSGLPIALTESERLAILDGQNGGVACDNYGRWLIARVREQSNPLLQSTLCDVLSGLPDHRLVVYDRMMMAHGLECRSPFLLSNLMEMGLSLPESERMTRQDMLIALKRVARRYLPTELLDYPESSLKVPLSAFLPLWFERVGGAAAYLRGSGLTGINIEPLIDIVEADLAQGVRRGRLLFSIVMLVEWWTSFSRQRADLLRLMAQS
ncbi:MAG: asparagine synthase (glutamine-hydrolyzing) [Hahellaceae bacterium]|nr:asparagine synthase (glutamine-hydrolyzing) [Hahellaceae bacterium]